MAYRQPRVPEYRESEGVNRYIRSLILFLKEFALAAWKANNQRIREIEEIKKQLTELSADPTAAETGDDEEKA